MRLAGVRVGQVGDVRFVPPSEIPTDASRGGQVEALLAIDSTIDGRPAGERIRRDSAAQLGSPSLLGTDKLINITPGSAVSEPIREGRPIFSGSDEALFKSPDPYIQRFLRGR